jgi:prepilin-type N-terminal cleavage/methylation domain-containing protein
VSGSIHLCAGRPWFPDCYISVAIIVGWLRLEGRDLKRKLTMTQIVHQQNVRLSNTRRVHGTRGFTLIEVIIVLLIGSVLTAMAIPQIKSQMYAYRLNSAVTMAKWAIQSTRFQALMKGYPYQVVFTASSNTYQIQNLPSGTTYANVGGSVPLAAWPMTFSANTTLQFSPNGSVTASVGALSFTITYQGTTKTITVSNYGNVTVTP